MPLNVVPHLEPKSVPLVEVLTILKDVSEEVVAERVSKNYPTMILGRWGLRTALAQDANLWKFMLETSRYAESALFVLKAGEFPSLIPPELHRCTMWYFRLPAALESHLEQLASAKVSDVVRISKDLMRADVHAEFEVGTITVQFVVTRGIVAKLPDTFSGELPCVLLLMASGRSLILSVHPLTIAVELGLCGTGARAGDNYRPYGMFSAEEIEAAKERVKREGLDEPTVSADGAVNLELRTYVSDA